ncbi:MAG: FtsX-like permease family protein, partial [Longimicrobiales bacterium]
TWRGRIGSGETGREVPVGWSTADMFSLLGLRPRLGRFYTAEEDRPRAAANVAVLDHGFWESEYGGAVDVLGQSVSVADIEYTIIGVAPPGFTGPELEPVSIWLPFSTGFEPHPEWPTTWNAIWLHVVTRTRSGVSPEAAAADATRVYRVGAEGHSASAAEGVLSLRPLHYGPTGDERAEAKVARWLLGVSAIVLLIAAANVMNLLLARMLRRRREIAVRLALGISRVRLARLLLSESLVLAFLGMAGALVIAYWGGQAIRLALLPDVQWGTPLGGRTLMFAAVATVMTGLLIGLAPALHSRRQDLTRGLRAGAGESGGRRAVARGALTVVQAAFSMVLLVGAGLFVRSLWNVSRMDLGIDADRVLAVWPTLDEPAQRDAFLREAVAHLRVHAGVEGVALALGTPLQGQFGVSVRVPGRDSIRWDPSSGPYITAASPGYFEAVGTRIRLGRGFEEGEGAGTEPVVVVNETMANALWPGDDALSKCLLIGDENRTSTELFEDVPCARVIGIAEDAHRSGILDEAVMQYYIPYGQERGIGGTQIVVRPRGDAIAFVPELRRVLHALDPGVRYLGINPLQLVLDPQIRPWRLGATMFLIFGCLALLIAAVGLYSVMAYGVVQRRTEIGVRIALGAHTRGIVAMTLRQGVTLAMIGVVAGSALALVFGPLIEPLLFQTRGRDALTLGAVAVTLAVVAVLASIIPAARAGRTDPLSALRVE